MKPAQLLDLLTQVQKWQQSKGNKKITVHCKYANQIDSVEYAYRYYGTPCVCVAMVLVVLAHFALFCHSLNL